VNTLEEVLIKDGRVGREPDMRNAAAVVPIFSNVVLLVLTLHVGPETVGKKVGL
jgi:hypothetical protein